MEEPDYATIIGLQLGHLPEEYCVYGEEMLSGDGAGGRSQKQIDG